ncbi:MAG: DNA internalization-related competence protein ComEC/Rec2 [Methylococcaceae bacterium]|nr:DNA internalization-related competence protein ComEC/Rec2 [Methylococcaceae bacterium]
MVAYALSLLAGIVLVQQLTVLPNYPWLVAALPVVVMNAWLRYWHCLFFIMGILWAMLFASVRLQDQLPVALEGMDIPVEGYIADLPRQDDRQSRFEFIVTESPKTLPTPLKLSWYFPDQQLKAGQHWSFTVKLKRPHGTFNPGGFDYERWLFAEGIGATGYIRPNPKPALLKQAPDWNSITVWRQMLVDRLDQLLPDSPQLALIKALTIGDGNSISQAQWDLFRKTGTTHLVVISGSHIGLIAGLVYFLVLRLWAWTGLLAWSPPKVAACTATSFAVFYSALAGFSVPTQRAMITLAIVMIAIVLKRNTRPMNVLAIALCLILLYDPLAVLSVGFWLSFLAVGLIIYTFAGRLAKPGYIAGVIKINWVTSVGLSPLLLFFFQQVSVIAPLANLIAVPIISLLVVPLSLIAIIALFFSPLLAKALFLPVNISLQGLCWFLEQLANIPMATITHPTPSIWALLFAIPGILLLLAPTGIPSRWLGLVLFLPMAFPNKPMLQPGNVDMTLLDVGQGLSAVVQTSHHVLVFDTGAKFSIDSDIGKTVLLPYLLYKGIDQIDTLIISHGDNDHVGGAETLMTNLPTKQLITSAPQQLTPYSPTPCQAGQSWNWDGVSFSILAPPPIQFPSENDNSCVLKIQSDKLTILLTGDIEAEAEYWLVGTYGENLKADILVAPHHGSKTSSTTGFLQFVHPDYVLIPAGYRNQFGHPHKEVLSRYSNIKATWLNTADSGAILINASDDSWAVKTWRETEDHYWNFR